MSDEARCITCKLSTPARTIAVDFDGADFIDNTEDIRRRDRTGRPSDMPSRADRNRARRLAHQEGFAWILSRPPRTPAIHPSPGRPTDDEG